MNSQTPEQFISTLQSLATGTIRETPEFVFMVALKNELCNCHWDEPTALRLAAQHDVRLPQGATVEQLQDMAYHYAKLITQCHDDLQAAGGYDGPSDEAALLAQRLVREAIA